MIPLINPKTIAGYVFWLLLFSFSISQDLTAIETQVEQVGVKDLNTITIDVGSIDLSLSKVAGKGTVIIEYIDSAPKREQAGKLKVTKGSGSVDITVVIPSMSFSGSITRRLRVKLPANFAPTIRAVTSSGDIDAIGLSLTALDLDASSGEISLNKIRLTDQLEVDTSSGDVEIDSVEASKIEIETSSGDQKLKGLLANKTIELEASSGSIEGNMNAKKLEFKTSSGGVGIQLHKSIEKIKGKASSGDITLVLPKEFGFLLDVNTSSGDIEVDFPVTIQGKLKRGKSLVGNVGDKKGRVKLNTFSGDITIKPN